MTSLWRGRPVGIVGLGLIGGSLGLDLRARGVDVHALVHRNGKRGDVTRALALLAENGLLERVLQPGDPARKAGRPAVNWRITDLGIAPPSVMPRWLEVARG